MVPFFEVWARIQIRSVSRRTSGESLEPGGRPVEALSQSPRGTVLHSYSWCPSSTNHVQPNSRKCARFQGPGGGLPGDSAAKVYPPHQRVRRGQFHTGTPGVPLLPTMCSQAPESARVFKDQEGGFRGVLRRLGFTHPTRLVEGGYQGGVEMSPSYPLVGWIKPAISESPGSPPPGPWKRAHFLKLGCTWLVEGGTRGVSNCPPLTLWWGG
jgi:hypothetical protein